MNYSLITTYVKDMDTSLEFYTKILGLPIIRQIQAGPNKITFLEHNGSQLELIENKTQKAPHHGSDVSIGYNVSSLEETMDFLKGHGIADIEGPIQPDPSTKFIYIRDPDGLKIQLLERKDRSN
ncbi:VOC family protein [Spirochaeta cellobiosiphila]|uniref:VOC family protein n=1 Tax=Spirochaeta cellobiosiphila TaxID=504483 RepID=UPI0003FC77AD|nr:VOC family protein [Spirochaeta cellobiosiphila]